MASAGASGHSTITPSCNRLLQRKWDEQKLLAHKERLRSMKASVDNGAPRQFSHIRQNARKHRVEEDRLAQIEHRNHELLTRMHRIMQTTGRVDHRNVEWKPKRSLNFVKRQREFDRIQRENQAILSRIQRVRPQYSTKKWESDFKDHQKRTKTLCLPPIESPPKASTVGSRDKEQFHLPPLNPSMSRTAEPNLQTDATPEDIDVLD